MLAHTPTSAPDHDLRNSGLCLENGFIDLSETLEIEDLQSSSPLKLNMNQSFSTFPMVDCLSGRAIGNSQINCNWNPDENAIVPMCQGYPSLTHLNIESSSSRDIQYNNEQQRLYSHSLLSRRELNPTAHIFNPIMCQQVTSYHSQNLEGDTPSAFDTTPLALEQITNSSFDSILDPNAHCYLWNDFCQKWC